MNRQVTFFLLFAALTSSGCGGQSTVTTPPSLVPTNAVPPTTAVVIDSAQPVQLSDDPFTDTLAQHKTAVEPSILAQGSTLVSTFQVGRIESGASNAIGWSTSTDGGTSWVRGLLPGVTTATGGTDDIVTDSVVAYDSVHGVWLVVSLGFSNAAGNSQVLVSRSQDGLSWSAPVIVSTGANYDKTWIACDPGVNSPYRGTCYAEWDDIANGQKILMSRSTDGGLTWRSPVGSADSTTGIAGQIAIQPTGTVVVPYFNYNPSNPQILKIMSADGGQSWSSSAVVASIQAAAIPIRGETDPTVNCDSTGKVYVAWYDCRFETNCGANDVVLSSSADGNTWSAATRISPEAIGSGTNHFIPVLASDPQNPDVLALQYFTSDASQCTAASCAIQPRMSVSNDGGQTWGNPTGLWPAFNIDEIANTAEGRMVGDYSSIAFLGSKIFPAFAVPAQPGSSQLNEEIWVVPTGSPAGSNP